MANPGPTLDLPLQTSGSWAFFMIAIRWNFICRHVFRKKLHDAIFLQVAIAWTKQAKFVLKKMFFD